METLSIAGVPQTVASSRCVTLKLGPDIAALSMRPSVRIVACDRRSRRATA